jgi:hypothetical protein
MVVQDQMRVQYEQLKMETHAEREELEKKRKASYDLKEFNTITPSSSKKKAAKRNSFMPK